MICSVSGLAGCSISQEQAQCVVPYCVPLYCELVTEADASYIVEQTRFGVFQKEIYNFETLHKFIQRTCAVF
jgi:hypothetical protein